MGTGKKSHIYICLVSARKVSSVYLDDLLLSSETNQKRLIKEIPVVNTPAFDDLEVIKIGTVLKKPVQDHDHSRRTVTHIIDVPNVEYGIHELVVGSAKYHRSNLLVTEKDTGIYFIDPDLIGGFFNGFDLYIDLYSINPIYEGNPPQGEYPNLTVKLNSIPLSPDSTIIRNTKGWQQAYVIKGLHKSQNPFDDSGAFYSVELVADGYSPHSEVFQPGSDSEKRVKLYLSDLKKENKSKSALDIFAGVITVVSIVAGLVKVVKSVYDFFTYSIEDKEYAQEPQEIDQIDYGTPKEDESPSVNTRLEVILPPNGLEK